jgi:hypothetical protein
MSILSYGGVNMKDDLSRFTLRVPAVLLQQLAYVAEFEGRTKNREIEQLIKKRITEFEANHGEIPIVSKPGKRER